MREFVGPYRVLETIGRGGMGIVYRGVHDNLGRQVAIKALAPELTQQPQFRERFFSEARTQAQLQHPNIVTIYDLIEDEGDFFIVMEFVEGRELDDLLHERQGRGLEIQEAVRIFVQVLAALDGAHSQGVIHRDVKSSNVLVDSRGQVKLMDFGIALLVGDKRLTQSSQTIGTPVYMSPEQILRPREVDHRTDIYSAAVLLYEMLSGQPPFDAETEYEIKKQHIEGTPADVSSIVEGAPETLSAVIAKALAKDPDDRYASAGEFLRVLRQAVPEEIEADVPPTTVAPLREPPRSTVPAPPAAPPPLLTPVPADGSGGSPSRSTGSAGARRSRLPIISAATLTLSLLVAGGLFFSSLGPSSPPDTELPTEGSNVESKAGAKPRLETLDPIEASKRATESSSSSPPPKPTPPASSPSTSPPSTSPPSTSPPSTSPPSTPSPPPPPPSPPPPPPPPKISETEIQRRTVDKLRQELRTGIEQAERHLGQGKFDEAQTKVQQLSARASKYQAELVDEVVALRLLDDKIANEKLQSEIRQKESEVQQAAWKKRLQEIQALIDNKKFPEAKNLARGIIAESSVPEEVSHQAEGLLEAADRGLKEVLKNMTIETKEVEVEGETRRAKRKREKRGEGGGGGGGGGG